MAHTCPYCGCYCTCSGDWDDIELPYEPEGGCQHYLSPDCVGDEYDHAEEEEYDFHDHVHVQLPSGAVATVAPDIGMDVLDALDHMARLAMQNPDL